MDECLFWIVPISILTIRRKNMETTKPTIDPPFTVLSGPCFKTNVWRGKIAREDLIMETLPMHKTLPLGVSAFPKARWNTLQVFVNLGVFDIWKKTHSRIRSHLRNYATTRTRFIQKSSVPSDICCTSWDQPMGRKDHPFFCSVKSRDYLFNVYVCK